MNRPPADKPRRSGRPRPWSAAPARKPAEGLAARLVAVKAVDDVLRHRTPLGEALDKAFFDANDTGLDERDRAFVRMLSTVTFRRLGTIRAAVRARLSSTMPDNAGRLDAILSTGAAQILFLDVPVYAAVDTAVTLIAGDKFGSRYKGLVNAVLRRVADDRDAILAASDALATDTPDWLAARWVKTYGAAMARAIAQAHRHEPPLDLSVKIDPSGWAHQLGGTALPTGSVRLAPKGPVSATPGYAEGAWWVQDAAAALPARLLRAAPGQHVLDLCAAPGGKTAQLAAMGAQVTAVDRSAGRLSRLSTNLERLGLAARTLAADAATLDMPAQDGVLVDAPCSATGTLRRHPDVAWSKREGDILSLADLQRRMLDNAAKLVKRGGTLVYCTCSLEPEEGEAQVEAFLARHPAFRRDPVQMSDLGGFDFAISSVGDLRTLPAHLAEAGGLDGFYAARLHHFG
jgi:16S rRNA (cytosine967-C5)-methyltransferase